MIAIVAAIIIFIILVVVGFACGHWFCQHTNQHKGSPGPGRTTYHRSQQQTECIDPQEQGLDLTENVAYISTQQIETQVKI